MSLQNTGFMYFSGFSSKFGMEKVKKFQGTMERITLTKRISEQSPDAQNSVLKPYYGAHLSKNTNNTRNRTKRKHCPKIGNKTEHKNKDF